MTASVSTAALDKTPCEIFVMIDGEQRMI
jgi:hypothetical protein